MGEIDAILQDSYFGGAAGAEILHFWSFAAVEAGRGRTGEVEMGGGKQPNITS